MASRLAKIGFQFVKFYLFSLVNTLVQYGLLLFLPAWIAGQTGWNQVSCQLIPVHVADWSFFVFDYPASSDPNSGLAYFVGMALTLFLAQCINFPMQRNITFRSKGNVAYQLLWYFVAWVLITIGCSILMSLYQPLLRANLPLVWYNAWITFINGGVQMVIYFPIFKLIFPEAKATTASAQTTNP